MNNNVPTFNRGRYLPIGTTLDILEDGENKLYMISGYDRDGNVVGVNNLKYFFNSDKLSYEFTKYHLGEKKYTEENGYSYDFTLEDEFRDFTIDELSEFKHMSRSFENGKNESKLISIPRRYIGEDGVSHDLITDKIELD